MTTINYKTGRVKNNRERKINSTHTDNVGNNRKCARTETTKSAHTQKQQKDRAHRQQQRARVQIKLNQ